jgi:hypothetical protein
MRFSKKDIHSYDQKDNINITANSRPIAEGVSEGWIHPLITKD